MRLSLSAPLPAALPSSALWRGLLFLTLIATWALMFMGAYTRASMAGISCPDWPLCHGYVVPPTDDAAYPASPLYSASKVYFEFTHRVLAALVATGAIALGLHARSRGQRRLAFALWTILALQIAMGAATVLLKNAPYTVVLHLALALSFLTVLLALDAKLFGEAAGQRARVDFAFATLVFAQLLIGAKVSSSYYGLACPDFPFCVNGSVLPPEWIPPYAWQLLHRAMGTGIFLFALVAAVARWRVPLRSHALLIFGLVCLQVLLGATNVWLRLPAWASALHLATGALLYAAAVQPVLARSRVT